MTDDLSARKLRPYALGRIDARARPIAVGRFGKGWVIVSPLDLTSGLSGSNAWGVLGPTPDYSTGVVKNVLVWAATAQGGTAAPR